MPVMSRRHPEQKARFRMRQSQKVRQAAQNLRIAP
jgi:hypothetical protein